MYLFFDTETTGLPKNWKAPVTKLDNWPRMVQIAWILSDENGRRIESEAHIIRPENFKIPLQASKVHGITTEKAMEAGSELEAVLKQFRELVNEVNYLVAHNISFDEKIVGAELLRKGIESDFFTKKRCCTMHASTNYCGLPGPYGYKWPKLSELHVTLFGEEFDEAHDAAADINATEKCFWKLRKMGLILT